MIFNILKWVIVVVTIVIAIKIFLPDVANTVTGKISETTGIEKAVLDENLDKASNMVKEKSTELTDSAIQKAEEAVK